MRETIASHEWKRWLCSGRKILPKMTILKETVTHTEHFFHEFKLKLIHHIILIPYLAPG